MTSVRRGAPGLALLVAGLVGAACGTEEWSFDAPPDAATIETGGPPADGDPAETAPPTEAGPASEASAETGTAPPAMVVDGDLDVGLVDVTSTVADGAGSDGKAGCAGDVDCASSPAGHHCLAATGACVQCVASADCMDGYCSATNTCVHL